MQANFFKENKAQINSQLKDETAQTMCTEGTSLLEQIKNCLFYLNSLYEPLDEVSRAEFLQLKRLQRYQSWFEVLDVYTQAINVDKKLSWPKSIAILDSLTMEELAYLAGELNNAFSLPSAFENNPNAIMCFFKADTFFRGFLERHGTTIKLVFYTKFLHSEFLQSLQSLNFKMLLKGISSHELSQETLNNIIDVEHKKSELESVFSQIISTGYLSLDKEQKLLYNTFPKQISNWETFFKKLTDIDKNTFGQATYQDTIRNLCFQSKTLQSDLYEVIKADSTVNNKMQKSLGDDYTIDLSFITAADITSFQLQIAEAEIKIETETKTDISDFSVEYI